VPTSLNFQGFRGTLGRSSWGSDLSLATCPQEHIFYRLARGTPISPTAIQTPYGRGNDHRNHRKEGILCGHPGNNLPRIVHSSESQANPGAPKRRGCPIQLGKLTEVVDSAIATAPSPLSFVAVNAWHAWHNTDSRDLCGCACLLSYMTDQRQSSLQR